jgi:hypothetical protein
VAAVVAISFLVSAVALSGEPKQAAPLVLQISATGWGEGGKPYEVGKPISVRVELKNKGAKPLTLMLRDHDPYLGTRPYPDSMLLRVSDSNGTVLTGGCGRDGWWNPGSVESQLVVEEPGDRITIPPGKHVTRVIPVDVMLAGCSRLPSLAPGRFVIQIGLGGAVSNSLALEVAAK